MARNDFDKASARLGDKVRDLVSYADGEYSKRLEALEARVARLETKHAKPKPRAT